MSLIAELTQEQVGHLDLSGHTCAPGETTVRDALAQMQAEKRNVCLVTEGERLVGIFTERDVLRRISTLRELLERPLSEVMTPHPVTVTPETPAAQALRLMEENHFRNLPVVDAQGQILGVLTHNTVIDYLAARYPMDVLNRPPDPERFPRKPEGG